MIIWHYEISFGYHYSSVPSKCGFLGAEATVTHRVHTNLKPRTQNQIRPCEGCDTVRSSGKTYDASFPPDVNETMK
jgi:hypothetical protein